MAEVEQTGRVARQIRQAVRAGFEVGERAVRLMARHAGDVADGGHARVAKQASPQFNGSRLAGDTIARVRPRRRGPRAEDLQVTQLRGREHHGSATARLG